MYTVSCLSTACRSSVEFICTKKDRLIDACKKVFLETIKRVVATLLGLTGFTLGCVFGIPSSIYVFCVLQIKVAIEVLNYLGGFIRKSTYDLYNPAYLIMDQLLKKF